MLDKAQFLGHFFIRNKGIFIVYLNDFIDERLADIIKTLSDLENEYPSTFCCGLAAGYKQALLEILNKIDEGYQLKPRTCDCEEIVHGHCLNCS